MANLQINNQQNRANSELNQPQSKWNMFVTHLTQVYILKQKDWLQDAGQTN